MYHAYGMAEVYAHSTHYSEQERGGEAWGVERGQTWAKFIRGYPS